MSTDPYYLFGAVLGIGVAVYLSRSGVSQFVAENFVGGMLTTKPILWFVVDDYGVNHRKWADFGARNSRELNLGFLNITRSKCAKTQGGDFEIRELLGRKAVSELIYSMRGRVPQGVEEAPPKIWKAWSRAAILTYAGGLYFDGFGLCLGPSFATVIAGKDDAIFGTDHDETHVTSVAPPGSYAGWSSGVGHLGWSRLATTMTDLIEAGQTAWTAAIARGQIAETTVKSVLPVVSVMRNVEWCRREDGRPLELEDILGRSSLDVPTDAVFVCLDQERLERDYTYTWFLRMSPEQILASESTFVWASVARR
uniref:Uncharacterized protein n=1 Tax=viral metagenome TaxID=1070528 RepID=A0A6C0KX87_9ZZZZ